MKRVIVFTLLLCFYFNVSAVISAETTVVIKNPGQPLIFRVIATDPDGDPLSYSIDFGDGTTAAAPQGVAVHIYTKKGIYTATATVSDDHGHIVTRSLEIIINDLPPSSPTGVIAI